MAMDSLISFRYVELRQVCLECVAVVVSIILIHLANNPVKHPRNTVKNKKKGEDDMVLPSLMFDEFVLENQYFL